MDEPVEVIRARAEALVRADRELLEGLVSVREARSIPQSEVGARMGVSQSAVSQFERYDANPTLASVRRYALAVGVKVEHQLIPDWYVPAVRVPDELLQRRLTRLKASTASWGSSVLLGCSNG